MKQKLLLLLLAMILPLTGWSEVGDVFTVNTEQGLPMKFKVTGDGICQVGDDGDDSCIDCAVAGSITIPSTVSYHETEYTVNSIGDYAFKFCRNLSSIVFPATVTIIGSEAFQYCDGLTTISLPEGVTSIGARAFSSCSGLESISLPTTLTTIGVCAFEGCSKLTAITIPDLVQTIEGGTFNDCTNLETLHISKGVNSFEMMWDFRGCPSLATITVDAGNTKYSSPNGCNAIIETAQNALILGCKNTTIPNGITSIESSAFSDCVGLTTISIPSTVTRINPSAFRRCTNLEEITLPDALTSIGNHAFYGCTSLTSINIPSQVSNDIRNAFRDCPNLASITVDGANATFDSRNNCNAIIETSTNKLVVGCKNTVIPSGVTEIEMDAFYGSGLTSINIPKTVTVIGSQAFNGSRNLSTITIDADNPTYDSRNNCNAIIETATNTLVFGCKGTVIPEGVTTIRAAAFNNQDVSASITIPASVTSIEELAFDLCWGLTEVHVKSSNPPALDYNNFRKQSSEAPAEPTIYVPIGAKAAYQEADSWSTLRVILEEGGGREFTAEVCGVTMSFTVINEEQKTCQIGLNRAWAERVPAVTDDEIRGKNLVIPETVGDGYKIVGIGSWAFYYSWANDNERPFIKLPNTIKEIGEEAFDCNVYSTEGSGDYVLPSSVTTIGDYAFAYGGHWKSLTIPAAVTNIGISAFPSHVEKVTVDENNSVYDSRGNCNAIIETVTNTMIYGSSENLKIPETVTAIGREAVSDLHDITITIPESVVRIDNNGLGRLNRVVVIAEGNNPAVLPSDYHFGSSRDESEKSILRVPAGCKEAYSSADGWKWFDEIVEGDVYKEFVLKIDGKDVTFTILDDTHVKIGCVLGNQNNTAIPRDSEGEITIPDNITYDGKSYSVSALSSYAFFDRGRMKSITIPQGIKEIPNNAFEGCRFTTFSMPSTLVEIGDDAFVYSKLKTIVIPETVNRIGSYAFGYCNDLLEVKVLSETPVVNISTDAFEKSSYKTRCALRVPVGSKAKYESVSVWKDFRYILEGDEQIVDDGTVVVETEDGKAIKTDVEYELTGNVEDKEVKITSVSIPDSEEDSGEVAIPSTVIINGEEYTVTAIAENALAGMTDVTDIYLPVTDKPITIAKNALKIDDDHVATIHSPLALLDDYAINTQLKENVEAGQLIATVNAPNKYWTFSCGVDVEIPYKIKVYKCKIVSKNEVEIVQIEDSKLIVDRKRIIKANNGVLVACPDDDTVNAYDIVANPGNQISIATTDSKSYGDDNWLEPVIEAKNYSADDYYVLKDGEFHVIIANSSKVPACKAVLRKPAGVAATRSLTIVGGSDGTTAISKIRIEGNGSAWYTLSGQRIEMPTTKGVYINNGKKVIIK